MIDLKEVYDKLYQEGADYHGGYDVRTAGDIRFEKMLRLLSEYLPGAQMQDWRMLDIGCSTGELLTFFGPIVQSAAGVDIADGAVAATSQKGFSDVHQIDVENGRLPFPDDSFDFITCLEVVEHLFDASNLLAEIHRVLKPEGFVFFAVPNDVLHWRKRLQIIMGRVPFEETPLLGGPHIRFFCRASLRGILEHTGFKVRASGGFPLSYRKMHLGWPGWLLSRLAPDIFSSDYFAIAFRK